MRFVGDFLRSGDVFVDVGSNVGTYTLLAAATTGVDIWAFEPSSCAFGRLRENVSMNLLEPRVRVYQAAVGASTGRVMLSTGRDAVNHVLTGRDDGPSEEVPMISLDQVLTPESRSLVSLIKVDVEGLETDVLRGAMTLLRSRSPALIVEANDRVALRAVLAPLGYRPFTYDPEGRSLAPIDWYGPTGGNLLLLREPAFVEERVGSGVAGKAMVKSKAVRAILVPDGSRGGRA